MTQGPTSPRVTPRLVATDLDGTVVRSDGTISARTLAAFDAVEAAGAEVVFVTGRPTRWMDRVADVTGYHGLAICGNGAVVFDLRRDLVVDAHPMTAEIARKAADVLRAAVPDIVFAVETLSGFSHEPGYPPQKRDVAIVEVVGPVDTLVTGPVTKLLALHPSLDPDVFAERARAAIGAYAEVTHSSAIALIEVSALGVSKATTLARLCEYRGISPAEVVAFGDMPNDLPLLAWAGQSYAVANAHPDVLASVANHTAANDDDGVALVLEELFPTG